MPTRQNRLPLPGGWGGYSNRPARRPAEARPSPMRAPSVPEKIIGPHSNIRARSLHDPSPGPHSMNIFTRGFPSTGVGHFYQPGNRSGHQFNRPAVKQAIQSGIRAHTRSLYFRHAGMGAAVRYTLGMEQVPSHLQDYLNARMNPRNQTGIHAGLSGQSPIYAHYHREQEGYEQSHKNYYSEGDEA